MLDILRCVATIRKVQFDINNHVVVARPESHGTVYGRINQRKRPLGTSLVASSTFCKAYNVQNTKKLRVYARGNQRMICR